ncbi:hypothetical protein [Chamaesiphon minutus]|nr:hypothetical protein [Chamaesiphon minutus]
MPTIVSCLAKPSGNKGVREPQIVASDAKSACLEACAPPSGGRS